MWFWCVSFFNGTSSDASSVLTEVFEIVVTKSLTCSDNKNTRPLITSAFSEVEEEGESVERTSS